MKLEDFSDPQDVADYVIKKFNKLKHERVNWDSYWQMIAEYVIPRKDNIYGTITTGENKHNRLYDSTSIHANEMLASALHAMLTNPSNVWFGLSTGDKQLDAIKEVRQYLQDSVMKIIELMNNSNFQTEIHEVYLDLGSIGTSYFRIEEDKENTFRFHANSIYSCYVDENSKGAIDTVYREYEFSLRQISQEFGEDVFDKHEDLQRMREKDPMAKVKIVHAIEPKGKRIASIHVLKKYPFVLREGSFNEQLHAIPRWTKLSEEKYGRSPAMKSLPDIKMINQMMRALIRAAQKVADPPLLVPDNGFLLPVKTTPGGTTIYRAGSQDEIKPLVHNTRLDLHVDIIEQTRERIRQAFFIDQLQLQDGPQMTATEVMQRTEEKLRMMGPILGRLHNELLKPIIDRCYAIAFRAGELPKAPDAIKGRELKIQYTSQIAKAQRASEADTFMRVLQSVAPVLEAAPQTMDNFNMDNIVRYHASIFGLPEEMLNSPDDVAETRESRAAAQEAQMRAELENTDADTQQKLANAQQQ